MSNLAILPVGNAQPALPCRHFPMPYQAVIWRNWGMVPMARLAQILDCSEDQLVHAAGAMGLQPQDDLCDTWCQRGYQTIIRQLLDFARRNTPQRKSADLTEVVRQTLTLLTPIVEKRRTTLTVQGLPPPLLLDVDAGQIQQVLTNLIVNSSEAMPGGGTVEIALTCEHVTPPDGSECIPGQYVRIDVIDHGEGIPPELLDEVFEPFFTTKEVGEGTGLGLSIAYGIVKEHGGWIDVRSDMGRGSCFSVYLPQEATRCRDES